MMQVLKQVFGVAVATLTLAAHATVGQKIDSAASSASAVANKVEKSLERGAAAAASGVEKGAKAAGRAADTGAKKLGVPGAGASAPK